MNDLVGQQFGNYRLTRLLGRGGFARVYLGEHIHLQTHAAVKVLSTQLVPRDLEHFLREAKIVAGLDHPHIVRVLDFGIEKDVPFLVMVYAPGGTLQQRHTPGSRLPLATVLKYVQSIASALQYAHNQKIIHRDVKPENVLVGKQGELLLSDFGIAATTATSTSQQTKTTAGTAAYMAPEQMMGKPGVASDQYALGIMVYYWLCGEHPFQGSFFEICAQHMHAPVPSLREKNPVVPAEVEQGVLKALAKRPEDRFASVQEFATALLASLGQTLTMPTVEEMYKSLTDPDAASLKSGQFVSLGSDDSTVVKPAALYDAQQRKLPMSTSAQKTPPTTQGPSQTVTPRANEPSITHPTGPLPPAQKPQRKAGKRVLAVLLGLLLIAFLSLGGVWARFLNAHPSSPVVSSTNSPIVATASSTPIPTATPTPTPTATPTPAPTPNPTPPPPTATPLPVPPTAVKLFLSAPGIASTSQSVITIPPGTTVTLTVVPDHSLLPFQTYTMGIYATDPYGFSELQYCTYPNTATCSYVVAYSSSENTDYTKGQHTFRGFLGNNGGAILTNSNSIAIIWS